jgi:integrase
MADAARNGIQLFIGDLELGRGPGRRSSPRKPRSPAPPDAVALGEEIDGQLELFAVRPDPHRTGPAAHAWAGTRTGQARLAELATFAAARGWSEPTTTAVSRAIALVAVADPASGTPSPEMVAELRRRRLPVTRLREFLANQSDQHPHHATPPALPSLPDALPTTITKELTVWLEVMSGRRGRTQPHAQSSIAAYLRLVVPIVREWAQGYPSLREVSTDDVAAQIEVLTGSARTGTAVALRSLFAALKSQRTIFADPARRVHPGRFPRRPVLGLDPIARADLLCAATRADHRLLLLLAGVHALSRAEVTALRIDDVDLAARRLHIRGRWVTLDEATYQHLRAWTDQRRTRWPATANPHLFLTCKTAGNLAPVSTGYFRGLPIPLARLRADRLLAAAADSNRDPLTLVRLFGVSGDTAVRYCTELDQPDPDR